MNPLKTLGEFGQSVWLDYIRRGLIQSGELRKMIDEDGLRGVTSNPAIFEKAIAGSTDYAAALKELEQRRDLEPMALYEEMAIQDIRAAADVLRPVYEQTRRRDGYVSMEVSPYLAHDAKASLKEAKRLWGLVARENLMIKVPATSEGLPVIEQLLSDGINVNITLLFSNDVYRQVAEAYLAGLEAFVRSGGEAGRIASVASFFVSRVDSAVDAIVTTRLKKAASENERLLLSGVLGKTAISNAKLAYVQYQETFGSERWRSLAAKGAQTQRLLWASTSTKNPEYRDVMYVEELIGLDTVNTIPPATFEAFRGHGRVRKSLTEKTDDARRTLENVERAGISMREVTDRLLDDGVRLFAEAFDKLLAAVEKGREAGLTALSDRTAPYLPEALDKEVQRTLKDWSDGGKVRRLWAGDAALWTGADEENWLSWLTITDDQLAHVEHLKSVAQDARSSGFKHALLLGMGGSSLCPEVMRLTFGKIDGSPELHILDSTDPAQIKTIEGKIDPARTLFIVSSKSGTTLEPNIFKQYFFEVAKRAVGATEAGSRFIAITDPHSKMQEVAERDGFRHVFFGVPGIGGRYSALSNFGMVPAAVMGVDAPRFLDLAEVMVHSCAASVPAHCNPGVQLGAIMGTLALAGRDKVTITASPGLTAVGAWLEQLLAESTGKQGKGLVPVDLERLGPPEVYGQDRLFVYLRLEGEVDKAQEAAIEELAQAGHPVVRIAVADRYALGQEFFRWEIATAVAGSIIGINAFNQPDVEASKVETRKLTDEFERTGSLPPEKPFFEEDGIKLFADPANASVIGETAVGGKSLATFIKAHLGRIGRGDYFGILAYIERNPAHQAQLQTMRHAVRDAKRAATVMGFGPRFLHSTGQAYKGGPNSGVFLQVTCDDAADLPVPGQKYTFGVVKAAQARGDFQVLAERKRRVLRVHLGKRPEAGMATLEEAIKRALV